MKQANSLALDEEIAQIERASSAHIRRPAGGWSMR